MFIHFVRFTTPLPQEQVRRIFEERATLPGGAEVAPEVLRLQAEQRGLLRLLRPGPGSASCPQLTCDSRRPVTPGRFAGWRMSTGREPA
jgi:hypothetical protein